ncbi:LacI family DNA-binding transcriptional regulator [Microbacterium sp. NPDC058342]|uniref:LacI family DNA-binding transcriptional regulator n=1 Tax=Microbacterium sp. NPDC058342 TaxID=3346454 RepID=UPI0036618BDC
MTDTVRPTLEMVAREAGVSRATVSRVVNGQSTVNAEMTEIVNAAIDRLKYVPNHSARALARRTANAVALVVPESTTKFFRDPFFVSVVDGIVARLDESDFVLNLLVTVREPRAKVERFLRSGTVDGTIVLAHHTGDESLADLDATAPTVFGGRPLGDERHRHHYVDTDNRGGAALAGAHLARQGRRRLATITGPLDMAVGRDRLDGFLQGAHDAGLAEPRIVTADFTPESAAEATRRLISDHPDVDGLFVANDRMALEVLRVLAEAGVPVPGDVSVVGFGDTEAASASDPALTTVRQPSVEFGRQLADTLLRLIDGDDAVPEHLIMPAELVLRDSA